MDIPAIGDPTLNELGPNLRNTRALDALEVIGIKLRETANAMTTISADLFSTSWIMYALVPIAVIVTVWIFFIVRHRMR